MALIMGTSGPDTLIGTAGVETIAGDDGNDVLIAVGPSDSVLGQAGNDTSTGSGDFSLLYGGPGADVFVVAPIPGGGGQNFFVDFNPAEGDRIDISAYVDVDSVSDLRFIASTPLFYQVLIDRQSFRVPVLLTDNDFIFYQAPPPVVTPPPPAAVPEPGSAGLLAFALLAAALLRRKQARTARAF